MRKITAETVSNTYTRLLAVVGMWRVENEQKRNTVRIRNPLPITDWRLAIGDYPRRRQNRWSVPPVVDRIYDTGAKWVPRYGGATPYIPHIFQHLFVSLSRSLSVFLRVFTRSAFNFEIVKLCSDEAFGRNLRLSSRANFLIFHDSMTEKREKMI